MAESKLKITAQNKTDKAFAAVNRNVRNITNNLISAKGAFGSVVFFSAAITLKNLAKEEIKFADAIAKTSDKLGIKTDKLQEYRFVANRTGVENSTLEKGLQNMVRGIADFSEGTGEAKGALESLNLTSKDLINLSPDEQFKLIADRLKGVTNNTEKLSIAYDLFGGRATSLINALNLGADGINRLQQEARDAGAVMDDSLIRKAEVLNDKFDTLIDKLGVQFRSALVSAADLFVDTRTETEKLEREMVVLLGSLTAVTTEGRRTWVQRTFGKTQQERIVAIQKEIQEVSDKLVLLDEITNSQNTPADSVSGNAGELMRVAQEQIALRESLSILSAQKEAESLVALKQEAANQISMINALAVLDQQNSERAKTEAAKQEDKNRTEAAKQEAQNRKDANLSALGALSVATASSNEKIFKIGKAASLASAVASNATAIIESYKNAGGYPFGIPAAAAMSVAGLVQINKIRSQKFSAAREHGGSVIAGRSYLVGEKRPEIFIPNVSGRVESNKRDSGRVDSVLNVTYSPTINDGGGVYQELRSDQTRFYNFMMEVLYENGFSF